MPPKKKPAISKEEFLRRRREKSDDYSQDNREGKAIDKTIASQDNAFQSEQTYSHDENKSDSEHTIDATMTDQESFSLEETIYRLCKDELREKILILIDDFITSTWNMHFDKHLKEHKIWETFNDKDFKLIFNSQLVRECTKCLLPEVNKKLNSTFTIKEIMPIVAKILHPFSSTKNNKLIYMETMKEWWEDFYINKNDPDRQNTLENFDPVDIAVDIYNKTKAAIEHLPYNSNTKNLIFEQLFDEKITFFNNLTENKFCAPESKRFLFHDVVCEWIKPDPYIIPYRIVKYVGGAYLWVYYLCDLGLWSLSLQPKNNDEAQSVNKMKNYCFITLAAIATTAVVAKEYFSHHSLNINNRHFMHTFIVDRLLGRLEELVGAIPTNTPAESRNYFPRIEYSTYSPNIENKTTTTTTTTATTTTNTSSSSEEETPENHKKHEKKSKLIIMTKKEKLLAEIKAAREENAANAHDKYFQTIKWVDDKEIDDIGNPKEYIYDYLDKKCPIIPLHSNDGYLKASCKHQYLFFDKAKIKELTDYRKDKTLYKTFKRCIYGTSEDDPNVRDPGHVNISQGRKTCIVREDDQYKAKVDISHYRLHFFPALTTEIEVDDNGRKVVHAEVLHVPYKVSNINQKK